MLCLVCSKVLPQISGRYGVFHACREHGTISVQGSTVVATGAMLAAIKAQLCAPVGTVERYIQCAKPFNLEQEVRNRMVNFGGYMSDLDLFVEGGEETANDDPDHWMNLRPY